MMGLGIIWPHKDLLMSTELGVNIIIPPEVQFPANWDAPLQNAMSAILPVPMPPRRYWRRAPLGDNHNSATPRLADESGDNIMMPQEVQLPANWDAPLQNPIPSVSPMPMPSTRRGQHRISLDTSKYTTRANSLYLESYLLIHQIKNIGNYINLIYIWTGPSVKIWYASNPSKTLEIDCQCNCLSDMLLMW